MRAHALVVAAMFGAATALSHLSPLSSLSPLAARFEAATALRVLAMSPDVVVVDKPRGLRSVPAFGPTRALLAEHAAAAARGEPGLDARYERGSRRARWAAAARGAAIPPQLKARASQGLPRTRAKFVKFAMGPAGGRLDDAAAVEAWDAVKAATAALEAADGMEESDSVLRRCQDFDAEARPVHRLDAATGGCLAVALTARGAADLSAQWRRRTVAKVYEAVVAGVVAADAGDVALPLRRVDAVKRSGSPSRMVVADGGLASRSSYEVVSRRDASTVLRLTPHTGRLHQLRAHCAGIGHPILGDSLYGDADSAPHLCLHATALAFDDPASGDRVAARSPAAFDLP